MTKKEVNTIVLGVGIVIGILIGVLSTLSYIAIDNYEREWVEPTEAVIFGVRLENVDFMGYAESCDVWVKILRDDDVALVTKKLKYYTKMCEKLVGKTVQVARATPYLKDYYWVSG